MKTKSTSNWIAALEAQDVPCGPINNYLEVFQDPQVKHRALRVDIPRGEGRIVPTIASPLRLQETPPQYHQAPPFLGEHTAWVLSTLLGRTAKEIGALRRGGTI